MIVYRVHHPVDKTGPYQSDMFPSDMRELLKEEHDSDDNHPSPFYDKGLNVRRIYPHQVCAFSSIKSLESWFSGWMPYLYECGFVVVSADANTYDSSEVTGQVIVSKSVFDT